MNRSLWIAATGMMAQQMNVDVIANNLSNVNTTGFKKSRVNFQDLLYQTTTFGGAYSTQETQIPSGLQVGLGTKPMSTQKIFSQGDFRKTDNPYDIVIKGDGFFQVITPDGDTQYSRDGSFSANSEGILVTNEGMPLEPSISIPSNTTKIVVGSDGTVSVLAPGDVTPQQVGQITIARFSNPSGLESTGRNLYKASGSSGTPMVGTPGKEGLGTIDQGYLENSNVDIAEEMIRMIMAQRAYEINSKAIQTADNMMGMANNIKR
ncbi:MAG: flagellar basal-body rod protein FlgG [Candidatus Margulisiibacteriota bacterium]|nr:MAG: flagellar basal-body rod protein FlgG [Candidatus Margulisbacteria bacterium GWD2_39_127]OGI03910.1 MAG: flagellar basal-body rod protein FlgG [Candidatus Margulisbacteria bacterium GWF2_38_17]OGI08180.1 MAG: flagellar basal-body rod protein FlgG [Candidatus Margulisbacteria bacterium GWE2_39_32]PZM78617.1 MAG: flagellar basal-body rod protein FlgG [Candidatus Margulisiibacteriota bacterium]HAR61957.1 flagellar basal-body rod protein FlgG [Candidatus Margulisiibacteriota bacterium]